MIYVTARTIEGGSSFSIQGDLAVFSRLGVVSIYTRNKLVRAIPVGDLISIADNTGPEE